jgi:S1-C subfamily serine protease
MVRSLSGPSGKVVGTKFVLDEVRSRFVYPQDNTLTVYFEFQAPKGDYVLTAYWKDPQGRIAGISPDLKIQTVDKNLNSYWVFMIDSNRPSGIWTVEIRINGAPVGSHSFELVVPQTPKPPAAETPAFPTLDEIYRSGIKSLVWVHKLDTAGRRIDTSTGFVVAPDSILTAFQSIDTAARIEIEFADGNKSTTDEILACNRLQDWAVVKAATRNSPPFQIGKSEPVAVGEQAIVFGIGSGTSRTIGAVDITGRGKMSVFGERININPQLPPMAVGGPLLDHFGKVIGVIGGSLAPGFSLDHSRISADLAVTSPESFAISVTPISMIALQTKYPAATLQSMLESGVITQPLSKTPVFNFGAITDNIAGDYSYISRTRFSRKSSKVIVYTIWKAKDKADKGVVSMNIYDANNRVRSQVKPQPLKLAPNKMMQCQYSFSPESLEPGLYRIDLLWNDLPIWRASISITD